MRSLFSVRESSLEGYYFLGLRAFGTVGNDKLDTLAFFQIAEAFANDRAEMDKHVAAGIALNEAEAFGTVEPLHSALFLISHDLELLSQDVLSSIMGSKSKDDLFI